MENWKTENLAETYLEGVRSVIPFAHEEIEILLRIIKFFKPNLNSFLDLGIVHGRRGFLRSDKSDLAPTFLRV